MFDIPEKGKDIVVAFLRDRFAEKKHSSYGSEAKTGVLENLRKKARLKNLLLSKSLIVKL
ncbi:MAG: hypothetical protein HN472_13740 [Nitrospina sp.]|jgi:hypothetical protein|nr:hypothetical protein [Nitrospina sp.]MBT3874550.1 hypothetical protein [Nitrospina sp.]MBT4049847.1 hypothetical protein [Nitrospina sp.]MBT4557887.1 hypothetical protein [Nitrospina sp.]MBT5349480.1 hypothetical protein [Nitrospina sp.]